MRNSDTIMTPLAPTLILDTMLGLIDMKTDPSEIPHTSTSASAPETKTDSCAISLENLSAAKH